MRPYLEVPLYMLANTCVHDYCVIFILSHYPELWLMNSVPSLWEYSLYYGEYLVLYLVHYTQPVSTHNIKSVKWATVGVLCSSISSVCCLSWFTYPKERTVKSDESKNNELAQLIRGYFTNGASCDTASGYYQLDDQLFRFLTVLSNSGK